MRIPKSCPDLDYDYIFRLPEEIQARMFRAATALPSGKYLHWDELRYRKPPDGLTREQWWMGIAHARSVLQKPLPVPRKNGQPFSYVPVDPIFEMTSEIDQRASGQIAMGEPVTDSRTRDRYILSSLIEEAITSSQLEGAATTKKVAKDMLRTGRKPKTRGERMILNNFNAMELIKEMRGEKLTRGKLLEIHRVLTEGTLEDPTAAGRFRRNDEEIVVRDDKDRVLHEPPNADELPHRLAEMLKFANGSQPGGFIHRAIRAIVLHFWLAYDHPFVDGNGRTARALFYWSMLSQGYWLAEFVSVSSILKKAPAQYARAYLHSESSGGDATYFILYQLRVFIRGIEALDEYLSRKVSERRSVEKLIKSLRVLNHRQVALVARALKHPDAEYTIEWHRRSQNVVYQTARKDLLEMEELGLFEKARSGKAYRFFPANDFEDRIRALGRGEVPQGQGSLFGRRDS